jgi:hypothetical protein
MMERNGSELETEAGHALVRRPPEDRA